MHVKRNRPSCGPLSESVTMVMRCQLFVRAVTFSPHCHNRRPCPPPKRLYPQGWKPPIGVPNPDGGVLGLMPGIG